MRCSAAHSPHNTVTPSGLSGSKHDPDNFRQGRCVEGFRFSGVIRATVGFRDDGMLQRNMQRSSVHRLSGIQLTFLASGAAYFPSKHSWPLTLDSQRS